MRQGIAVAGVLAMALAGSALRGQTRPANYALILQDEPVTARIHSRAELHSTGARRQLRTVAAAQQGIRRDLARRHVPVVGSSQLLLNAIFVRVSPDRLPELAVLPGVKKIAPLPRMRRHMDQAVQLMGVPAAWNAAGGAGNAGAGVKIGILDTGIDQNHPAFQDPALAPPPGFPLGDPNFTNSKVIVARSYMQVLHDQYQTVDDLSPRDHSGHGTAVAMIAAGAQNTGPLATIAGIAPKAWLGSYKIYGTPGVNDDPGAAIPMALDDAYRDGMDIVLLPFGGQPVFPLLAQDCPGQPACDAYYFPIEQAVRNAIANGMTVVISAGNDGNLGSQLPTLNTINSPGSTPEAITVGAAANAHAFTATVQVAGMQNINALFGGDEPAPAGPLTAPLRDVSKLGNDGFACAPLPDGSLNGAIALIQRGHCDYYLKINNAQTAGAVGVIVFQPSGNDAPVPMVGMLDTGIPSVMIGNADGVALQNLLQSGPDTPVTLDPTLQAQPLSPNTVTVYSSRGPTHGDSQTGLILKPDLVAVGDGIYTATQSGDPNGDLYDPNGYRAVGGTSFAAAVVAGAAALVKQANPGFTPGQVKSALVNTATDVMDSAGVARVTAAGAGELNAGAALAPGATVEPATLSFGAGAVPVRQSLKITNTGSASATFTLAVSPRDNSGSVQLNLSQTSLTLNPGDIQQVSVQLTGASPPPGSYEGFVTISGPNTNLRVPYLYLVGDGQPVNILPIKNFDFVTVPNDYFYWLLDFKLVDQYGVPVTNYPVAFHVVKGGGIISPQPPVYAADATTDKTGVAGAWIQIGPQAGDQIFTATAGGLTTEFDGWARASFPAITSVVDANTGQAPAPGATATISGSFLSDATKQAAGAPAIQLGGVTVSFDAPGGTSVPGLLSYVSPSQITVQIPGALAGQSSAQMTVKIGAIWSAAFTVKLAGQ